MRLATLYALLSAPLTLAGPLALAGGNAACTPERRIAGTAQLVKTVATHSITDAAKIPLSLLASRTAFLKDTEFGHDVTVPVSLGVTGDGVRAVLVGAATAISARVLEGTRYTVNQNGSVTADFIQPDTPILRCEIVKEIHDYDLKTCQIIKSTVYAFGKVIAPGPNEAICA